MHNVSESRMSYAEICRQMVRFITDKNQAHYSVDSEQIGSLREDNTGGSSGTWVNFLPEVCCFEVHLK